MPFITEGEAQHFNQLRNEQARIEEESVIDLDRDLKDPDVFSEAAQEIRELPEHLQEGWLRKLIATQEDQIEEAEFPDDGPLDQEQRAALHGEMEGADTPDKLREVLARYGQLDE
jgi:hypothetical protein